MPFLKRTIFNKTLYFVVFVFLTLMYNFCYVSRFMNYTANIFLMCWGLILIFYDVFGKGVFLRHRLFIPFSLFLAFFAVTVLYHAKNGFLSNGLLFLITAIEFFVLCTYDLSESTKQATRSLSAVAATIVITSFPLSLGSLILFASKMQVSAYGFFYGFTDNRLYGLYTNPNPGGIIAFFSIAFSLVLLIIYRPRFKKSLIFNIIIQFSHLALTLSRGSQCALTVFSLFFVFFLALRKIKTKKLRSTIMAAAAITIAFSLLLTLILELSRSVLSYVPETVNYVERVISNQPQEDGITPVPIDRDYSNGFFSPRTNIWQVGLNIYKDNPVLGAGPYLLIEKSRKYLSLKQQSYVEHGGLHNGYLQVLVACGAVGFLSFMTILFLMIRIFSRYALNCIRRGGKLFPLFGSMMGIVFALIAYNIVESKLLLDNCIVSAVFWIISGYSIYFCLKKECKDPPLLKDDKNTY